MKCILASLLAVLLVLTLAGRGSAACEYPKTGDVIGRCRSRGAQEAESEDTSNERQTGQ